MRQNINRDINESFSTIFQHACKRSTILCFDAKIKIVWITNIIQLSVFLLS